MDGFRALTTVLALGAALLLLAAGIGHATRPRRVRWLLTRQGLLPPVLWRVAAPLLGVGEIAVAVGVLGAVAFAPHWTPAGYAVLAGGYAVLATYAEVLRRRRPGMPCGCLPGAASTGLPVVVRALFFSVAATAAAVTSAVATGTGGTGTDPGGPLPPGPPLWLAAGVTAAAGWLVPELAALGSGGGRGAGPVGS